MKSECRPQAARAGLLLSLRFAQRKTSMKKKTTTSCSLELKGEDRPQAVRANGEAAW
jgi:hypothetical protein